MLWHLIKYNKQHCIGVAYWCSSSAKQPHMGEKERTLNGCKSFFEVYKHTHFNNNQFWNVAQKKPHVLTEICAANDATKHGVIYKQLGTDESS